LHGHLARDVRVRLLIVGVIVAVACGAVTAAASDGLGFAIVGPMTG
jgi:hypothetical protein